MGHLILNLDRQNADPQPAAWSLSRQFAIYGGIIMFLAAILAGSFVSTVISRTTLQSTATSTAIFLESFIEPLVQTLAYSDDLGPNKNDLDELLKSAAFRQRFPHLEIWKRDGSIVYSTSETLIGSKFAAPDGVIRAQMGDVQAGYADLKAQEHVVRQWKSPFLEIYVPIREQTSGRVIAVAEIHEMTEPHEKELWYLRSASLFAVAGTSLIVMITLFGVVHRGSNLIENQRSSLRKRLNEIQEYLAQNEYLREKVQLASMRVSTMNERYLRQIGAELHDGPAQLLGLAALSVEHVRRARTKTVRESELARLSSVISDALQEVRKLSRGLMLPEIKNLPIFEVMQRACLIHQQRTGTAVSLTCPPVEIVFSHAVQICVYRFVQEGLTNAFRHAAGAGQSVECSYDGSNLTVIVSDSGAKSNDDQVAFEVGLGLTGLRERVESLGGMFRMHRLAEGTSVEMSIPLRGELDNG